jgi:iron-sulfur cluster repair protein YtfE (RIC family)
MKASKYLKEQHQELRSALKHLLKANGHSRELLGSLASSLSAHLAVEQELFYPAAVKVKEGLVLEGYEEHVLVRFALKRLMRTPPGDPTFKPKVKALRVLLESHLQEEEDELFPAVEKALGDASAVLCAEMKALHEITLQAGYERTVGSADSAIRFGDLSGSAHA